MSLSCKKLLKRNEKSNHLVLVLFRGTVLKVLKNMNPRFKQRVFNYKLSYPSNELTFYYEIIFIRKKNFYFHANNIFLQFVVFSTNNFKFHIDL